MRPGSALAVCALLLSSACLRPSPAVPSAAPRAAAPGECSTDADCRLDDGCHCGPCTSSRAASACEETCAPPNPPVCERAAAACDASTHRCVLLWAGRVGANPGDPADELRACLEQNGARTAVSARPSWAGTHDPSQRPRPELLNWTAGHGCVSYPGAARSRVECPGAPGVRLPLVTPTLCMQ